jgi:hypothetical protein
MKKLIMVISVILTTQSACVDFLDLAPEDRINENAFWQNANDVETALIGNYATLQDIHDNSLLYLTELTTDNAEIQWTSPTISEFECNEMNITLANSFINAVWNLSFRIISRSNNIIAKMDDIDLSDNLRDQYRGEALFLRAYSYFNLVRLFGDVPIVTVAFRSPTEVAEFDMSRKPVSEVYDLIISDLLEASNNLDDVSGLSKSRASTGASKTLLGKVYLTLSDYSSAATILKEVIDMDYSLATDYQTLFTNDNDELGESIFEVKYLSGNIGEGNSFSSIFTPPLFNMAIFPGNMNGSGRINPTSDIADSYEVGDLRRIASIEDSVLTLDGTYEQYKYGLKFVDFTTGLGGDGGINYTALRFADVLLMYAEALNDSNTPEAHTYLNMVRERAGLDALDGLSKNDFALALEQERRLEFFLEGHRWFDLVRTGRAQTVMNSYFTNNGLNFSVEDHELLMPVPQRELDINPNLKQNPGY